MSFKLTFTYDTEQVMQHRLVAPLQLLFSRPVVYSTHEMFETLVTEQVHLNKFLSVLQLTLHIDPAKKFAHLRPTDDSDTESHFKVMSPRKRLSVSASRALAVLATIHFESTPDADGAVSIEFATLWERYQAYIPADLAHEKARKDLHDAVVLFTRPEYMLLSRVKDTDDRFLILPMIHSTATQEVFATFLAENTGNAADNTDDEDNTESDADGQQ